MRKQPLLIMLVCFIVGIFLYDFFCFTFNQIILLLVSAIFLVIFSFFKFKFSYKFRNYFLGFLFFTIGVFSHFLNSKKSEFPDFEEKQKVTFQLTQKLNSNKKYRRYEVKASVINQPFVFNLVISVPKDEKLLNFENYYQTEMYLNKVKAPNNDFQFNYAKYLERKNIYYQSFLTDEIIETPKKIISLSETINQKRLDILYNIDNSKLLTREKEFLKGIILADRTEMDAEMVQDFSKSGLVHFLAISGTHLAIIFWVILYLLKPIFSAKHRKIPIIISIILIWSFAVFIGCGSSVVRSCLMITAYYGFIIFQRKPDFLHAVAIAGFAILIFDTHQLFDVGFQLSFIAVLGIFWLNDAVLQYLPTPKNKIQDFLVNVISVSFAAQIVTLPLVIFYFHQYSFLSIIVNLIIVPFSEIIIVFSLLMTVLFAFKIEFYWLDFIYENIINLLLKSIHFFAMQDWFFIKNISLNLVELVILFGIIFLLKNVLFRENKSLVSFLGVLILFFSVRIFINFYQFQRSEVLVIENFNQKIILQKEKDKAIFWIDENANLQNVKHFIVEPYVISRRVGNYEIKTFPEDFEEIKIDNEIIR